MAVAALFGALLLASIKVAGATYMTLDEETAEIELVKNTVDALEPLFPPSIAVRNTSFAPSLASSHQFHYS